MKMRASVLVCVAAAACGPKAAPTTTTGNTGGEGGGGAAAMTAAELWAPVMKPGAIFTFTDRMPDGPSPEEFHTVEVTVAEVKDAEAGKPESGKVAVLTWTLDGEPLEMTNLPQAIVVTPTGVKFQSQLTGEPEESQWPATTAVSDDDRGDHALYIHEGNLGGERCYGLGPGKDSGECEDVCFVEVCVHPKHGLTGGSGTWWPDMGIYQRRDLSK